MDENPALPFLAFLSIAAIFACVGRWLARHAAGENMDGELNAAADELTRRGIGWPARMH